MKAFEGNSRIASLILTWAVDAGEWSPSRPGSFTPGEEFWCLLSRRFIGPQSRSGRFQGSGKCLAPAGIRHPGLS